MANHFCAFYSHGPHYVRVLKKLRAQHPEARITAVVPPLFPPAPIQPWVDEIIFTGQTRYSLRELPAILRLLRQLRAARYTHFVTLFDSTRLRLIARASGAPHRLCHTPDGRAVDLRRSLARQALHVLLRNVRGRLEHARIARIIRTQPVEPGSHA